MVEWQRARSRFEYLTVLSSIFSDFCKKRSYWPPLYAQESSGTSLALCNSGIVEEVTKEHDAVICSTLDRAIEKRSGRCPYAKKK